MAGAELAPRFRADSGFEEQELPEGPRDSPGTGQQQILARQIHGTHSRNSSRLEFQPPAETRVPSPATSQGDLRRCI